MDRGPGSSAPRGNLVRVRPGAALLAIGSWHPVPLVLALSAFGAITMAVGIARWPAARSVPMLIGGDLIVVMVASFWIVNGAKAFVAWLLVWLFVSMVLAVLAALSATVGLRRLKVVCTRVDSQSPATRESHLRGFGEH